MILDAFSGVGWDLGARTLGIDPIGIDHDAAVCATRSVLGMPTIRADVATFPLDHLAGRVAGLIASPPCQAFSAAGKRLGLADVRGLLVFEVLRWTETLRPRWLAAEQVPEVLPIWRIFRDRLAELGYSVWCGVLDAANYGVPQNRKRAFLLASLGRVVTPPEPTHSQTGDAEMFGAGRQRWVSMAEALGWAWDGRIVETQNGSAAPSGNYFDPYAKPSRTICGARTPRWLYEDGDGSQGTVLAPTMVVEVGQDMRIAGGGTERYTKSVGRPAPTVDTQAGSRWKLRHPGRSYTAEPSERSIDEPAPCVALVHNSTAWVWERPATCVQGTPRVAPPGYRRNGERQFDESAGAIPVQLWELGVLQGFPPDLPWQGNKTEQARTIGNAVPPPMAAAVLRSVAA